ncbi:MAG TPA: site-2 protease family protein, partial [Pseudobacillus sp.]
STDTVAKSGIMNLMKWAGVLSINLGIMNLLPLPALDGGRLLFFLVEALRGKPIDRQKEGMVHFVGFALLMLLMIVVTWNDIQRFFLQ